MHIGPSELYFPKSHGGNLAGRTVGFRGVRFQFSSLVGLENLKVFARQNFPMHDL